MPYGYSPERRIKYLQGYEFESEEEEEEGVLEGGGMVEGVEKVISTEILAEFQQHYYVIKGLIFRRIGNPVRISLYCWSVYIIGLFLMLLMSV